MSACVGVGVWSCTCLLAHFCNEDIFASQLQGPGLRLCSGWVGSAVLVGADTSFVSIHSESPHNVQGWVCVHVCVQVRAFTAYRCYILIAIASWSCIPKTASSTENQIDEPSSWRPMTSAIWINHKHLQSTVNVAGDVMFIGLSLSCVQHWSELAHCQPKQILSLRCQDSSICSSFHSLCHKMDEQTMTASTSGNTWALAFF